MDENEPPFYSQVAANAMAETIEQQRATIRRLNIIIGALEREATHQAETIEQQRATIENWRAHYTHAITRRSQ